jgi:hypothetical protein
MSQPEAATLAWACYVKALRAKLNYTNFTYNSCDFFHLKKHTKLTP